MNPISTDIQVWFLRHGKTPFDYDNSKYDDFIQMLCNGHETPLAEDPGIDFKSLPQRVDFVGHSQFTRAFETAKLLENELYVKKMGKMPILDEVRFDIDIINKNEFESLKQIRPEILRRWYNNENKAESFKDSLTRVKKIESFLIERQEKTIILVTHGWFLRLLDVYFVQGKHTDITLNDILATQPVPLGHFIKATVARKGQPEPQRNSVERRYSGQPRVHADR
jgi:broad specificity phosphatase PhoE